MTIKTPTKSSNKILSNRTNKRNSILLFNGLYGDWYLLIASISKSYKIPTEYRLYSILIITKHGKIPFTTLLFIWSSGVSIRQTGIGVLKRIFSLGFKFPEK